MTIIRLVVRQGPHAGQVFELQQPSYTIGRSKDNDLQIDDVQVSRRHATLTLTPGGYVLQDQGSTNGTFVNNRRITAPIAIQPGDVIGFGNSVLIDVQAAAPARPAAAPPPVYAPPPPPPPIGYEAQPASHTARNLAIGCGILLALLICVALAGYLTWAYAPPSIAGPICDVLRPLPLVGSLCP